MSTKFRFIATLFIWFLITIVFIITSDKGLKPTQLTSYGALYTWKGVRSPLYTLITYGFLHTSFRHYIHNLLLGIPLMLYIENKVSSLIALMVFMFGVMVGGIGFWVFHDQEMMRTVGASAGIWALLGASTINLFISAKKPHALEVIALITLNITLFYDTIAATNVNAISHYYGYITALIVMILLVVIQHEKLFKKHMELG